MKHQYYRLEKEFKADESRNIIVTIKQLFMLQTAFYTSQQRPTYVRFFSEIKDKPLKEFNVFFILL